METKFSLAQLADPEVAHSEKILRTCVHCGFCTATCPTYVLLGDELDSPRGRIYLIKDMLENDRPASAKVVKHIDRCLSCLSCMTTCPSGVHYMHLVDHARTHIERTYTRPFLDRALRTVLAFMLPSPARFRLALIGAWFGRPLARFLPGRLGAMFALAPASIPSPSPVDRPQTFPAEGPRRARVALMTGCAQQVLAPDINEATIRLLTRHGVEVVVAKGAGCCGALTHHMGKERPALAAAKANIAAWTRELEGAGLDAVIINASGCGTTVKDYGHMLRTDAAWASKAARIAGLTKDITEFMATHGLKPPVIETGLTVAYHAACSMQHGQKITRAPKDLLAAAGFALREVPEGHLCCGSAGTYNLMQPEIATRLRDRKVANIESVMPDAIATGNIGCMTQIATGTELPILHTVALLDWATGGPVPKALEGRVTAAPAPAAAAAGTQAAA
ncbi:MAG: glycolate oxidase subunit GlcF [Alphaproteobacteria bacterium]|nr:glycolate oxidase subunit GlcF [Alphaproteobacteria bacterium]